MSDPARLDTADRRRLRSALSSVAPWLTHDEAGPTTVDAGACDRCGNHPRLLPTCGPVEWRALCLDCGMAVGLDAWCDGHAEVGRAMLAWASGLPEWWADAVVLWWVATGEVAWDPSGHDVSTLPAPLRAALPSAADIP